MNNIESKIQTPAGYFNSTGSFVPVQMNTGENIRAWIEFDGERLEINVTVAPVGVPKPLKPTLTYRDSSIVDYVAPEMFFGFSASKTNWIEAQRVLAWSFSDEGSLKELNTTNLPVFKRGLSSKSLSSGAIAGIVAGCFVFVVCCTSMFILYLHRRKRREDDDDVEDWEMEYWPHRFSYEELSNATKGFQREQLLGFGGFGKVYKGTLMNKTLVAVKCVNHDSKQGLREFMAEISSMGRLQHKNLVQMSFDQSEG